MKKINFIRSFIVLLALITYGNFAQGQRVTVTGTVTDATNGEPIPGVTILVKGTTMGTSTDLVGKYSIQAESNSTLSFSFIGYEPQDIPINGRAIIDVALNVSSQSIEDRKSVV